MKTLLKSHFTPIVIICLMSLSAGRLSGQSSTPEVLDTGTLEEQLDYLEERTRIYNDFRAIREDMFQKIKSNSLDSLEAAKNNIQLLEGRLTESHALIETQQADLQEANKQLEQAIKNRDRMIFIGIPMQKALYNSIVWMIIAALATLSVILFLSTRRSVSSTRRYRRDLEETKEEFEAYRKQSRERQEQLVVKHHQEIRKLKGK